MLYIFALRAGKIPFLCRKWLFLPRVIQIYTKFANFTSLYFLHFTILATNLCSFTYSKMLFLAVVLDFILFALIKI
jgi:hypothetical protein